MLQRLLCSNGVFIVERFTVLLNVNSTGARIDPCIGLPLERHPSTFHIVWFMDSVWGWKDDLYYNFILNSLYKILWNWLKNLVSWLEVSLWHSMKTNYLSKEKTCRCVKHHWFTSLPTRNKMSYHGKPANDHKYIIHTSPSLQKI